MLAIRNHLLRNDHMKRTTLAFALLLFWVAVHDRAFGQAASPEAKIRNLMTGFRGAIRAPEKRMPVALELLSLGEAGRAQLITAMTAEIAAYEKQLPQFAADPKLDDDIAKLRQTMKELRDGAELTKEKIEQIGDPAMQQLAALHATKQQRAATLAKRKTDLLARAAATKKFLDLAQEKALALPLDDWLARTTTVIDALAPTPEEQQIQETLAANAVVHKQLDPEEAAGLKAFDEMRIMLGLAPMLADMKLTAASRGHSADMARLDFFAHESPVEGKKLFTDRAKLSDTTASGENIHMGSVTGGRAMLGWFHSPGHHKNMFAGHTRAGLGRSGKHWTQMFGR